MAKYRGTIIGLGWMGMLYDLAQRMGVWHVDDIDRPTPELDLHRNFHYHDRHLSRKSMPSSHAEALSDRPEIELVAAAERDRKRLAAFGERYGVQALYTDAMEMLRQEKPMAYTLEEADHMVKACADADVPLCCGAISTSHPLFGTAKDVVKNGAIGEVLSIEAESDKNLSQHQNWSYFVDSSPAWVIGLGDLPKQKSGSNEFRGQGMMVSDTGLVVHFRKGAPAVRITGTEGELFHPGHYSDWPLLQDVDTLAGRHRIEMS